MQRYAKHNAPIILEPDETLAFSLDCHSKPNRITLERNVKTAYLVSFVCFLSFGGIWAVSKRLQRIFPQSPQTVQQRSQIFDRDELQFLRTGFNWNYGVIILHWALCSISHSLSTGNEFVRRWTAATEYKWRPYWETWYIHISVWPSLLSPTNSSTTGRFGFESFRLISSLVRTPSQRRVFTTPEGREKEKRSENGKYQFVNQLNLKGPQ